MRPRAQSQLSLTDVSVSYARRPVLDHVDVRIAPGERVGIVGENGSGKSTLLKLIAGVTAPDDGTVTVHAVGGAGYLGQIPDLPYDGTVQDAVDAALSELRSLEREMRELESDLSTSEALTAYGDLMEAFEARDGWAADARVDAALQGLGLGHLTRERNVQSLSGGEQARLALAGVLAAAPELLLLDEPTNHLDNTALSWLEERLRTHRGTVVTVSHDRLFLERTTTALLDVDADRHTATRHGNGYSGYLNDIQAARVRWEQEHREWADELVRQTELAEHASALLGRSAPSADRRNGRHQRSVEGQISGRVRNARERAERLRTEPVPKPPEPLRFTARVPGGTIKGPVAELREVRVADRLYVPEFTVKAGERLLVTGPNGAGKSTLLRVLAGVLTPSQGRVRVTRRLGYLAQEDKVGDPARTLLDAFGADRADELLALGLFREHDLSVPVGRLSVGQRRRLELARVLTRPVDLLLLDEPTNHLSLALVEQLEEALVLYPGAVVVVSHDRLLRGRFTGRQVALG